MEELEIGLKGIEEITVQRNHLASVWGNVGGSVFSTHQVVLLIEKAARKAVEGRLPEGTMTVGTRVDIRHLAAAPIGERVRAECRLRDIRDRTLVFDVVAYDQYEKLAEGINEQVIVSAKKFLEKVRKKQVRISSEGGGPDMMFWV
jgi:predicted thioesterase